jgi:hypothetical protein
VLALGGCASKPPAPTNTIDEHRPAVTDIEIAEYEVSSYGADRFTSCPPPGELGQAWIPPVPAWTPTAAASSSVSFKIEAPQAGEEVPRTNGPPHVESVQEVAHVAFRHCYHRGLLYDPTQDGRVAIVMRIAKDGRVARTEAYGACDLSTEAIRCMMATAESMRFDAPTPGQETLTVPVVFHPRAAHRINPKPNDSYTAAAYVALESSRAALHACEEKARAGGGSAIASATFSLDLDARGKIASAHIDPWTGDQDLLSCAAQAVDQVGFPPPPAGRGHVLMRLSFNPRPGTK